MVLALGNELLGDDGIGVLAARKLSADIGDLADITECDLCGLALLDVTLGYDKLVIIDGIASGTVPPGTIIELNPDDLKTVASPSPHYAGLPEVIDLAERLQLDFPKEIRIFAVEIKDRQTIGASVSPPVAGALDDLTRRVKVQLRRWAKEEPERAPDRTI